MSRVREERAENILGACLTAHCKATEFVEDGI